MYADIEVQIRVPGAAEAYDPNGSNHLARCHRHHRDREVTLPSLSAPTQGSVSARTRGRSERPAFLRIRILRSANEHGAAITYDVSGTRPDQRVPLDPILLLLTRNAPEGTILPLAWTVSAGSVDGGVARGDLDVRIGSPSMLLTCSRSWAPMSRQAAGAPVLAGDATGGAEQAAWRAHRTRKAINPLENRP